MRYRLQILLIVLYTALACGLAQADVVSNAAGGGGGGDASAAKQDEQTQNLADIEAEIGALTDAAATAGSTGSLSAKLRLATTLLDAINTAVQAGGTAANQTTLNGYVDGLETLIGTTNSSLTNRGNELGATTSAAAAVGDVGSITAKLRLMTSQLDAIQTSVQLLDNAVSGSAYNVNSHAVTNAGTFATQADTELPAAAALADATSNPTIPAVAAYNMCFNGTTWDRCAGTSTTHYLPSAASTNSTNVKNAAGTISAIVAVNTTATIYYLRLYNASSAPTCSSATNFVNTIPIPASTSGGGIVIPISIPVAFTTGISYCLTGGGSSTDNTNAATGVYLTMYYK